MPFISEAAGAIKIRFGFQDQSSESMPSVRSSPNLLKSVSHDNLFQSSAVRVFGDRDDCGAGPVNQSFDLSEDPSFWKDHNVQEKLFKVAGVPMVENCVEGYNSCMFACGQGATNRMVAATNMNHASSRSH
ncbi:hypothetical protein ACSBR2_020857 [Camellia fascicularis]